MAQRARSGDRQTSRLIEKCLVVVFKEKRSRKSEESNSKIPLGNGASLFEQFIDENKECYWNPHLEESINNVKYHGFFRPLCLLIAGRDIYIETIIAAWSRRVLRAPANLGISKVGFLEDVCMTVIPQTQFTPLPEVLCLIISKLTRAPPSAPHPGGGPSSPAGSSPWSAAGTSTAPARAASLEAILQELAARYHGMQQPSEHLVYQALGSLCSEGNIYHTGAGYHINKPNMDHLNCPIKGWNNNLPSNGAQVSGLPSPPLPAPPPGEVCSVSCQTEQPAKDTDEKVYDELQKTISEGDTEDNFYDKPAPPTGKKFQRSLSLRSSKKSDRSLHRTASLRPGQDKTAALIKDINLKTSNVHRDKDKGEKQSVLKKLFGRNKQHHSDKKNRGKESEAYATSPGGSSPEQRETPLSEPTKLRQETPLSDPARHEVELATFSAQFPPPEWQWHEHTQHAQPVVQHANTRGQHLPPHLVRSQTWHHQAQYPGPHFHGCALAGRGQHGETADLDRYLQARMAYSLPPGVQLPTHPEVVLPEVVNRKLYSSSSDDSFSARPLDGHIVPAQRSMSPAHAHQNHQQQPLLRKHSRGRKNSIRRSRKVDKPDAVDSDPEDSNLYCEPEFRYNPTGPGDVSNPEQFQTNLDQTDPAMSRGGKPTLPPPRVQPNHQGKHKQHRNHGNDISVEYHGRMPRRNTGYSMSRDSGVNCVGVTETSVTPNSRHQGNDDVILNNERHLRSTVPQAASTPRENNNLLQHQATVHHPHHQGGPLPQDSGFSSPRVEAEKSQAQNSQNSTKLDRNNKHRSKQRVPGSFSAATNRHKRNMFLSNDSLEITGSEFYPSYHGGIIPDHQPIKGHGQQQQQQQQQGSSSISTSSTNQTVLERPGYRNGTTDSLDHQKLNGNSNVEISGAREKGKYHMINNNVKSDSLMPDKDAYRPILYNCCSNDGKNGNEAQVSHDHHVNGSHDVTSEVVHRTKPHHNTERSSFLGNCQVVGVL